MTNLQIIRILERRLPPPTAPRLVLLIGARQVGKTTLARAVYPGLRYVNLDAVEDRDAIRAIPTASWAERIGAAVLDEVQKEPSALEKIKFAYDAGALRFSVLLGSAQILLLERVRESLAGRVFIYELWPLTLSELAAGGATPKLPLLAEILAQPARFKEILEAESPRLLGDDESRRLSAFHHLSLWGGMPELIRLADPDRNLWLRSYHDTYLQRDLADLARLRDLEPFFKFQKLAALRTGGLLSFSELARDAGTSAGTARNYLEYLKISYQVFLLQPFSGNLTSAVVKTPKLYWSDLGIARHLSGNWGPSTGPLFETWVVSEAVKLIRSLALEAEPSFYRTRSGMEIDLVLETPAGLFGIEIKGRDGWARADFGSLRAFAGAAGKRFLGGIVVHQGSALEPASDDRRLWAVPAHRLFS
jgi:hypothetical protein